MMSVVEVFQGHVAEHQDESWLRRLLPIGTLTGDDDYESVLTLVMVDDEEIERIVEVEYSEQMGLSFADSVHGKDSFVSLLAELCERPED
jgi:hypothetical protein